MKKLVQIAEQYVEWVALALGGVFLLLMMVMYLLGAPVSKELGGKKVTLSDVDRVIYEDQGRLLDEAMSGNVDVPLGVKPFAGQFKDALAEKDVKPIVVAEDRFWFGPGPVPTGFKQEKNPDKVAQATEAVNKLPEPLPAAEWNSASTGRSLIPVSETPGVAAVPAAVVAVAPGGAATPAVQPGIDKLWVTEAFSIPTQKIADAFAEAKIPAGLPTAILAIELIREEQLPDGQWGHPTLLKPLSIHQILAFPAEGNVGDENAYLDWATRNTTTLILPSFHMVVGGDKWYAPGQANPNTPLPPEPKSTPVAVPSGPPRMTPPTRQPSGGSRNNRRQKSYAPADSRPATFDMFAQAAPGGTPPWAPGGQMPPGMFPGGMPPGAMPSGLPGAPGGYPGAYPGGAMPGQGVGATASAVPDGFTVPNGNFVPSDLKKNIFVWAHDDTVEAGNVYRYKLRYRLKSPVYRSNVVSDPKLARQFSLVSAESEWSEAVVVPPTVYVFLVSGVTSTTTSAKFDVLRWQNGKWWKHSFTAEPGDMIGGPVKDNEIDYTTGYSLVDMKLDVVTRDAKVVLSDRDGELSTRSLRSDQSEIIAVQKLVGYVEPVVAPKPGAPGAPGAPGMPGMPGGFPPGMMPPGMMPGMGPPPR